MRLTLGPAIPIFYIKAGAVATNLSTDKIVDGIARLITKTDISKLGTPQFKEKTIAANTAIQIAEEHCSRGYQAGHFDQDTFDPGRFSECAFPHGATFYQVWEAGSRPSRQRTRAQGSATWTVIPRLLRRSGNYRARGGPREEQVGGVEVRP